MIRKLTQAPARLFARGPKATIPWNNSTLLPPQPDEQPVPYYNLPTGFNYIYTRGLPRSEIEARIFHVAHKFLPLKDKEFSLDRSFAEIGLDSLDQISFICALEREFHCVFEETVFDNFTSGREVLNHMSRNKYCF